MPDQVVRDERRADAVRQRPDASLDVADKYTTLFVYRGTGPALDSFGLRETLLAILLGTLAALAIVAGILFANCVFVSPTMFSLAYSAQVIIWVIVGGKSTLIDGARVQLKLAFYIYHSYMRPPVKWMSSDDISIWQMEMT